MKLGGINFEKLQENVPDEHIRNTIPYKWLKVLVKIFNEYCINILTELSKVCTNNTGLTIIQN